MVYESPIADPTHCIQPVEWVGRWKFLNGRPKVWSCDRHADELPWARRVSRPSHNICFALRANLRSSEPNPGRLGPAEVGGNPDN